MIVNLTQHPTSAEQADAGVIDAIDKQFLSVVLTFVSLPDTETITAKAKALAAVANDALIDEDTRYAMIGGAPYLMSALENELIALDITPLYSFSERVSTEETQADGTVKKVNVFRHQGWVQI